MKLLLAGDSFSELSGYVGHKQTVYNISPPPKAGLETKIKHWVELLADDIGAEVVPHGLGGGGISQTSFIAMQQLINHNYDGLIFFTSHHSRIVSNTITDLQEWSEDVFSDILWDYGTDHTKQTTGVEIYKNNKMFANPNRTMYNLKITDVIDRSSFPPGKAWRPQIISLMRRNIVVAPKHLNYMLGKPGYSYMHDSVTALVTLKSYCDAHNIPVVFASGFENGPNETVQGLGIDFKHFPLKVVEHKYNLISKANVPSHYNSKDHEIIYTEFKKLYPEYKTMFTLTKP
tara:strand:- start:383 stop:1246 length:864 start_codon:yes stop_codon:yes gene_type:complete